MRLDKSQTSSSIAFVEQMVNIHRRIMFSIGTKNKVHQILLCLRTVKRMTKNRKPWLRSVQVFGKLLQFRHNLTAPYQAHLMHCLPNKMSLGLRVTAKTARSKDCAKVQFGR